MNNNFDDILNKDENSHQQGLSDLNDVLNNEESISEKSDDDFDKEAAEGLQQIAADKIPLLVNELNRNLNSQLKTKKRLKKKEIDQSAVIITIITLLVIIVIGFIIIKKYYQQ